MSFIKGIDIKNVQWQDFRIFLKPLLIMGVALVSLLSLFIYLTDIPGFEELENPRYDLASIIYDVRGESFGRYFVEDRVPVKYEDISAHIKNALLVTEDERFYQHSGIDFRALFRVGIKSVLLGQESSGGGSTISQQLAKLLYQRPSTKGKSIVYKVASLVRSKFKEWVIAVKLEKRYTKEEIMSMYLNKFEFINGAHGIEAASQIYFNKPQKEVSISEAATLIGMLKNPVLYNPGRFPEKCKERRNNVLFLMKRNKLIKDTDYEQWTKENIDLSDFKRVDQSEGWGPYFRAELTKELRKVLKNENIKKSDGSEYDLYRDGLKIYTTIDLTYQKYAEQAVWEHLASLQQKFWRVWKNMDPWTYEANGYQKKLRADILESQCKSSDRYQKLRDKHLNPLIEDIQDIYPGLILTDRIIMSLDSVKQKKLAFSRLKQRGVVNKDLSDFYQNLLEEPVWNEISRYYRLLQEEFEKEFSTPVMMKVFDYNENGEKEVDMTPLDSVRYHKMHLQSGFLVIEPSSGHVKAWVGGSNHKYFKFDHVTMRRSVGSTIKPFVYTQAMAVANISPCDEFEDIQYTIAPGDAGFSVDKEWSPANADNQFTGNKYNLFHGLLYSKNSITVKLLKEMGTVEPIINIMDNLGIDKNLKLANGRPAIPRLPSICLGAVDLTLMEITGAYTAFANNGTWVQPVFISRIEDKNGRVLFQSIPHRRPAINPLYNAVMVAMLKNNVGGNFGMGIKSEIGGKTGTTNDYSDGWFVGVSPTLVLGAWTGGDDKWIRFLNLNDGQGFITARPVIQKFMQKLEADNNSGYDYLSRFTLPPSGFDDLVNCQKNKSIQPEVEKSQTEKENFRQDVFDEEF